MKEGRFDVNFYANFSEARIFGFPLKTIKEVCSGIFQGAGRNLVEESDTVLLKVKNILGNGSIDYENVEFIADAPESKILLVGDIISPFIGEAVKQLKFVIFERSEGRYIVDNNCGVMRPDKELVSPQYLQAVLSIPYSTEQILQLLGGGGVPFLGSSNAAKIQIPLPPLETQTALVTELETARTLRRDKLSEADALLAGLDGWLLEQLGLQPPAAQKRPSFGVRLSQVRGNQGRLDVKVYEPASQAVAHHQRVLLRELVMRSQQRLEKSEVEREDYITLSTDGTIKPKRIKEWREVEGDELFKAQMFVAQEGQIVFSKIDLRSGAIAIVDRNRIAVTAEFPVYDVDATRLNPDFLVLILRSSYFQDFMNSLSSGHSGRKRVHPSQFEDFLIPLPPLETQTTIAAEARRRRDDARRLRGEADAGWQAAKTRFENQLLGGETP